MAQIALFDSGRLESFVATNQINAKSNSSNQDFSEILGQAKNDITTKESKNTVVENYEKKGLKENEAKDYKTEDIEKSTEETKIPNEDNEVKKDEPVIDKDKNIDDKVNESLKEELDDDVIKEIQETFAEIMMVLEQMIGQDSSDFEEFLQELNINMEDFLSKDPKDIVMMITQKDDVELITDENLLNTVNNASGQIEELLVQLEEKTKLPKDELETLMSKLEETLETKADEPVAIEEEPEITSEIPTAKITENADENIPQYKEATKENEIVVSFKETKAVENIDIKDKAKIAEEILEEDENPVDETKPVFEKNTYTMDEKTDDGQDKKDSKNEKHETKEFVTDSPAVKINSEEVMETDKVKNLEYTDSTTRESILKQIQDNLKVLRQNDETTMEFMLHPQSLGNVKIAITTKAGSITAQISAQNETVKEALESQVTQLKTNLEEQGVKVEAVEISVQSHNLERNLDQNGDNRREQQDKEFDEKVTKLRRRNINLKAWAEGDEIIGEDELDDDTRLTAQMMEMYGNSMDLLA